MRLRRFREEDARCVISWVKDEDVYYQWCGGLFGEFPLTEERLNWFYRSVQKSMSYWILTAEDANGAVGHITMRFTDKKKKHLRLGFVLIDAARRGEGLGKQLVTLAMRHGVMVLGAKQISLGVFEENIAGRRCYESLGFMQKENQTEVYRIKNEERQCIEMFYIPK